MFLRAHIKANIASARHTTIGVVNNTNTVVFSCHSISH